MTEYVIYFLKKMLMKLKIKYEMYIHFFGFTLICSAVTDVRFSA